MILVENICHTLFEEYELIADGVVVFSFKKSSLITMQIGGCQYCKNSKLAPAEVEVLYVEYEKSITGVV